MTILYVDMWISFCYFCEIQQLASVECGIIYIIYNRVIFAHLPRMYMINFVNSLEIYELTNPNQKFDQHPFTIANTHSNVKTKNSKKGVHLSMNDVA